MNKQQELAEQIAKKYKLLITNEESLYRRNVLAAIVEAMGVQQEKEQPSLQSGKLSAEEVLYKHVLADADNHVMGTTLTVTVPPLEELKNNQQFQMHVAAMKEYAQQFQTPAPAKEGMKSVGNSIGQIKLFDINYHSSYAVWNKAIQTVQAKDQKEALDKFWKRKNKESFEVTSVTERVEDDDESAPAVEAISDSEKDKPLPPDDNALCFLVGSNVYNRRQARLEAAKEAISVPAQQGVEDIEGLVNRLWSKWSLEYEGQTIMSKDLFTLAIQDINAAQSIQPSLEENKP
jgi:hypothetical protein